MISKEHAHDREHDRPELNMGRVSFAVTEFSYAVYPSPGLPK